MTEAKNLYQNRRSVYALGKNLPISEQEVIVTKCIQFKHCSRSSFIR